MNNMIKVRCINEPIENNIIRQYPSLGTEMAEVGKIYTAYDDGKFDGTSLIVKVDGKNRRYDKNDFITIEDYRDEQINTVLND